MFKQLALDNKEINKLKNKCFKKLSSMRFEA